MKLRVVGNSIKEMMRWLSMLLCMGLAMPALATQHIKTIFELKDSPHRELVEYALTITEPEYGPAALIFAEQMTQGRVEQLMKGGQALELAVFAPDIEREQALLPVYFPLSRGLLGYRVCLIKQGQQPKFDTVTSLDSWREAGLLIGQGANWPDVQILRANNILVTTNPMPPLLFNMLRQQRFDCFARGVNEVEYELRQSYTSGLALEAKLLFYYPQPALLFVSPNRPELAKRLQLGLDRAWHDGYMQQHFSQRYGKLVNQLRCEKRRLLVLHNPFLSQQTESAMLQYALSPEQLLAVAGENCPF